MKSLKVIKRGKCKLTSMRILARQRKSISHKTYGKRTRRPLLFSREWTFLELQLQEPELYLVTLPEEQCPCGTINIAIEIVRPPINLSVSWISYQLDTIKSFTRTYSVDVGMRLPR